MMLWYPLSIVRRTEPAVPSEQAEEFQTEDGCRLVEYDRGVQRRTTKPLRLYFQKAVILKTLAVAFGTLPHDRANPKQVAQAFSVCRCCHRL
jgi:hypothetical protein